jgi:hypothetical protein
LLRHMVTQRILSSVWVRESLRYRGSSDMSLITWADALSIFLDALARSVFRFQFFGRSRHAICPLDTAQIAAPLGGGLVPFAAAALVGLTHGATWPVSVLMIVIASITIYACAQA